MVEMVKTTWSDGLNGNLEQLFVFAADRSEAAHYFLDLLFSVRYRGSETYDFMNLSAVLVAHCH
jgi:hypothetical protein